MSNLCCQGIIKAIRENDVTVEITIHEACQGCSAKSACMMNKQKQEQITVKVTNPEQYQVGEVVSIEILQSIGAKAVMLAYLFPFLMLTIFLFTTYAISKNELLSIGVGFFMTAGYYLMLRILKGKVEKNIVFTLQKNES